MTTKQWNGLTGQFTTDSGWSPTGTPATNDLATLAGTAAYLVTEDGSITVAGLVLGNPFATLAVGGALASIAAIEIQSGTIAVGASGSLLAATTFSNAGIVTIAAGQTLTLGASIVTNTGSIVLVGGTLRIPSSFAIAQALRSPIGLVNTGQIVLTNGAVLDITAAALSWANLSAGAISVDPSSTLSLSGTLGLGGATVNFRPGSVLNRVQFLGETLANGTVDGAGAVFGGSALTLNNVSWTGSWTLPAGMSLWSEPTSSFSAGTVTIAPGGSLLETGTLDSVTIALGQAGASGTATLAGTILDAGPGLVVGPTLGANAKLLANGNAVLGLARNFGTILVQSGSLTVSGNAHDRAETASYSPVSAVNQGSIIVSGGVLRLDSYSDYQPGTSVPTGQIIVGNGGGVEVDFTSALASTTTHANVIFADGFGTLTLGTTPAAQLPTVIAVSGFTVGDTILSLNGGTSQFDAPSQTLTFFDPVSSLTRATITFTTGHSFSAAELVGLGGANIGTSYVAAANIPPSFAPGTRQWLGQTGNFADASQWAPIGAPTPTDTASLAGTVAYVASQSGITTVGAVILNNGLATLSVAGTLAAPGGLALQHGVLYLPGTLRNTLVTQTGGSLLAGSSGTLDGVTWAGDLAISGGMTIRNRLTLHGVDGTSPGQLIIASGNVTLADVETLDFATIHLGGTLVSAAGLTLGAHAIVQAGPGNTQILATDVLTNAGLIVVSGGTLALGGSSSTAFVNAGSIIIAAGAELDITAGTMGLAGLLGGTITTAATGTLVLAGTLDLGSTSLSLGPSSALGGAVFRGATLANGTIDASAGQARFDNLSLHNIAWRGPMTVGAGATLVADATDSFLDASGSLGGIIDLSTAGATLAASGLLDNVTITLGNAASAAAVIGRYQAFPGGQIQLTPPSLGPNATIQSDDLSRLALTRNQGMIIAQSGTLSLSGAAGIFANAGIVQAVGAVVTASGQTDYQAGNPIPVGQTQIGNGGVYRLGDATGLGSNHINASFIDNNGTFDIATHPATSSDMITIIGWVSGAVITADFANTSQFDAASNSLRFSDSTTPGEAIIVSLGTTHIYSARELIGLGSGTVTTDFVASPITNIFPPPTQAAPQWLGISGNFGDASLWTPTGVPDATGTASLAGTVAYVVNQAGSQAVGGLVLADGQATLTIGGSLTAGNVSLEAGTLNLVGTLRNASVSASGGELLATGGTLDSISWRGDLLIAGSLSARNGLVLRADDGSLPGSLTIASGSLTFADNETLDNATISLAGTLAGAAALGLGSHTNLAVQASSTLTARTTLTTAGTIIVGTGGTLTLPAGGTLINTGVVNVTSGTLVVQGKLLNTGVIGVQQGGEIDFTNTSLAAIAAAFISVDASSRIVVSGTLDLGGGSIVLGPTSLLSHLVLNGATLVNGHIDGRLGGLQGTVAAFNDIAWRGPLDIAAGRTLTVDSATRIVDATTPTLAGTIDVSAGGQLRENGTLDAMQINLGDQSSIAPATLWGGIAVFGTLQDPVIGAAATIVSNGNASLTFVRNFGTIVAQSGTLVLAGRNNGGNDFGTLIDSGATILVSAYTNYGDASLVPAGEVSIANRGVFMAINPANATRAGTAPAVHARIVFSDATGTVAIQAHTIFDYTLFPSTYTMPATLAVAGFQVGDVIRVSAGTASFNSAGNELTFFDSATNTTTAVIDFDSAHLFDPSELIGIGGTSVSTSYASADSITACFSAGTRITTPGGPVAIEALRVGDQVIVADGSFAPIVWLGHRSLDCGRHPRPHDVRPVRVMRGSFGAAPCRDLWLSPDHAIFIEGVLVPVRYLENGATIRQWAVDHVTYWHIELARHAVILAEELPCETYLDTGNRHAFIEGGPSVQLHPEFARAVWKRAGCAHLVTEGAALYEIRNGLDVRAREIGFVTTDETDLHIAMGGVRLDGVHINDVWHFNIPVPGMAEIRSRRARPSDTDPASGDGRTLGVAIANIVLNGGAIGLGVGQGWLPPEGDWCWTDGAAELELAEIGVLTIAIALTPHYWLEPDAARAWESRPDIHKRVALDAVGRICDVWRE